MMAEYMKIVCSAIFLCSHALRNNLSVAEL